MVQVTCEDDPKHPIEGVSATAAWMALQAKINQRKAKKTGMHEVRVCACVRVRCASVCVCACGYARACARARACTCADGA